MTEELHRLVIGDDGQILIEVDLEKINSFFICSLCSGYFRDAHTIPECLHTFCKSCLVLKLRVNPECPQCKCKTSPSAIKLDRNIDSLFQKLYPQVLKLDEELEKEWYRANNIPMPEKQLQVQQQQQTQQQQVQNAKQKRQSGTKREEQTKRSRGIGEGYNTSSAVSQQSTTGQRQPLAKVKLTLQSEDPAVTLDKPYIEASGGIKVDDMRKYIAEKLHLPKERIFLSCNGQLLASEHSTEFIQRTMWNDPGMNMVWTFRVSQSQ